MKRQGVEALREAIMSDVERDRQHILQDAQTQAQSIISQARTEAEAEKAQAISQAETEVDRIQQQVIGAAKLEAQALRARTREGLLDEVFEQAMERLSNPDHIEGYSRILQSLIQDGAEHLGNQRKLLIVTDRKSQEYLDDGVLAYLEESVGCELSLAGVLDPPAVGVVLQLPDGRIRYDNTLRTRLGRMRESLRPLVYRLLMGNES